ncbi:hypothetical protein KUTeg_019032 [Tegillarca granosa]|uniref:Uncharacterized protein n=1 Tax=Tegillarca granosa TaxID=220873 RepID=A0ABQ9EFK3_TEGGR|nr:hypothetical protein KUTeg_019032 [Tegillarca granosa]
MHTCYFIFMTEPEHDITLQCPEMTVTVEDSDTEISPDDDDEHIDRPSLDGERRPSKWSATILFVASEIQLIFNLAELCPQEGFETVPKKGEAKSN